MARIKANPLLTSISGAIGDTLIIRRVGDRSYVSAKPERRRKRETRKQSAAQQESRKKFAEASWFSKHAIKQPEIHEYFSKIALDMGGTNNAYTALISFYRKTPGLTQEKLLDMIRSMPPEESKKPEQGLTFSVKGPNGDTIAQGVAVSAGNGQWTYTAPFTGVQVIISDQP
jgi:hypothetical protein